jgi:nucleotide-binding universal stress UspA family protein
MKKILVPTDFSELAFYACEVAAQIARKSNAWIYLVHVSRNKEDDPDVCNAKLQELMDHEVFSGLNVSTHLKQRKLEGAILSAAQEHDIDLIVMGSHGKGAIDPSLVGSNTARVVRLAEFPVLVVKSKEESFEGKRMVFASSFFGEVDAVFPKIQGLAELLGAHMYLLKVITPRQFEPTSLSENSLEKFATEHRLKNYSTHVYNHETKEAGIMEFAESVNADVIALVTHGRKGLSQFILGSVAETVANRSNIPVLSLKLPEAKASDAILFPE